MMTEEGHAALRRFDMHCHLDFAADPRALAACLGERGIGCFSVTVDPEDYERAAAMLATCGNVRVGLGLHPWWVVEGAMGTAQVERFETLLADTKFVGEVGLDFGAHHEATREAQVAAFGRIAAGCAAQGGKVLSIHAVHAADAVLDILERCGMLANNACIFHWFSGSSDELQRAIKLGCFFSVGERTLATKRGRAYVQAIPRDRLLLETDLPPEAGSANPCEEIDASLLEALATLCRVSSKERASCIAQTSREVLKFA